METWFIGLLGPTWGFVVSALVKIVIILAPLILCVAYMTYFERKVIGFMQLRVGPNVTGPFGLIQPFADVVKLLMKEIIRPTLANKGLYLLAPVLSLMPAFAAWAVIPFSESWFLTNVDASLLYIMAITSFGVYGVIIAGCSVLSWNWLSLFPLFVVYLISGVAETNRAPFDVAEGESEIVAGFHVEYSGMAFALFFLAEYINMILIGALTALLFLGGWLSPFPASWGIIGAASPVWMFIKMAMVLYCFLWFRATFPRYRYDQIMRLGWKVFIPVTLVCVTLLGLWMISPWSLW